MHNGHNRASKMRGPLARGHRPCQPTLAADSGNSKLLVDFGADGNNKLVGTWSQVSGLYRSPGPAVRDSTDRRHRTKHVWFGQSNLYSVRTPYLWASCISTWRGSRSRCGQSNPGSLICGDYWVLSRSLPWIVFHAMQDSTKLEKGPRDSHSVATSVAVVDSGSIKIRPLLLEKPPIFLKGLCPSFTADVKLATCVK